MSGKQVYIDEEYHNKLKLIAMADDTSMKELVEQQIESMEPQSVNSIEDLYPE